LTELRQQCDTAAEGHDYAAVGDNLADPIVEFVTEWFNAEGRVTPRELNLTHTNDALRTS